MLTAMTAEGIRARNRAALEAEVLRLGREHLATYGAAALSLRAIARDLGMASSAVYRYVESREELLTRLIISAFDSLADEVEAALATAGDAEPLVQFRVIARTTRAWALAHPHEYALIYGSPVPGYHAPAERTVRAGTRVPGLLTRVLARLPEAVPSTEAERAALGGLLADPMFADDRIEPAGLRRGLAAWTLVLGAISTEVFEYLGRGAYGADGELFELMLDSAQSLVVAQ